MVTIDFKMGEYAYRGMIFFAPDEGKAIEVGVDNRGGRAKGTWELEDGKVIARSDRVNAEGEREKVAVVHSRVDARAMKIALHRVSENGDLSEDSWATMEFRRRTRQPGDRPSQGAWAFCREHGRAKKWAAARDRGRSRFLGTRSKPRVLSPKCIRDVFGRMSRQTQSR